MGDFLSDLGNAAGALALDGLNVQVETTANPGFPINFDLTQGQGNGSSGASLSQLALEGLKPRVAVYKYGQLITEQMPFGDPRTGVPWGLLVIGAIVLLVLLLLFG